MPHPFTVQFRIMLTQQTTYLLLVDDDEDDRYIMIEALQLAGYRCETIEFANGSSFLRYLEQEIHQEVPQKTLWPAVLDFNLPGLNGEQILQIMGQHPLWQQIPVIMMTGQQDPGQANRLQLMGAVGFIPKASSLPDLIRSLQATLAPWFDKPRLLQLTKSNDSTSESC
jgi:CheY-like chemotaxis protein